MNITYVCFGIFLLSAAVSTILVVTAIMNSSQISKAEEEYEPLPYHSNEIHSNERIAAESDA